MFVCVCRAVSDRRIRRAVDEGAVTLRDLTRDLAVGTCCGKCVPQAREILERALAARGTTMVQAAANVIDGSVRYAERA